MKSKKLILCLWVSFFSISACAQQEHLSQRSHQHCCKSKRKGRYLHHNGLEWHGKLTKEQKKKIKSIKTDFSNQTKKVRKKMRDRKMYLNYLLAKRDLNVREAQDVVDEITKLRKKLMKKKVEKKLAIRKVVKESGNKDFFYRKRHKMRKMNKGFEGWKVLKSLSQMKELFSEEEREKLLSASKKHKVSNLRLELRETHAYLMYLMQKEDINKDKVLRVIEKQNDTKGKLQKKMIEFFADVKTFLSIDQQNVIYHKMLHGH